MKREPSPKQGHNMEQLQQLESGHTLQSPLIHQGGELLLSGRRLSECVEQAGGTPCYLYDIEQAKSQIEQLRAQLPQPFQLYYAVKANPNKQVLESLLPYLDGLDIASNGELEQAMASGYKAGSCSFAGPSKSTEELSSALAQGAYLSAESQTEVKRILHWAESHQEQVQFGLRVNPDFELKASGMHMGGGAQPFGIDEELIGEVIELVQQSQWGEVTGLHIYAGSQCLNVESLLELYQASLECFIRIENQFNLQLTQLNLGGGLGVPYFPGNQPIDLGLLGSGLSEIVKVMEAPLKGKKLILELGRYIMAAAGYYVCRVNDVKRSRGEVFVMVDGGMHHHLANSGNLGQLLRKNYPVVIANKLDQESVAHINIAGPLCTPLDVVAKQLPSPELAEGDYVVVLLSGAYGLTASPIGFLSQPKAREFVLSPQP